MVAVNEYALIYLQSYVHICAYDMHMNVHPYVFDHHI